MDPFPARPVPDPFNCPRMAAQAPPVDRLPRGWSCADSTFAIDSAAAPSRRGQSGQFGRYRKRRRECAAASGSRNWPPDLPAKILSQNAAAGVRRRRPWGPSGRRGPKRVRPLRPRQVEAAGLTLDEASCGQLPLLKRTMSAATAGSFPAIGRRRGGVNPGDCLLLLCPWERRRPRGVVRIFQRPDAPPAVHRSWRFCSRCARRFPIITVRPIRSDRAATVGNSSKPSVDAFTAVSPQATASDRQRNPAAIAMRSGVGGGAARAKFRCGPSAARTSSNAARN